MSIKGKLKIARNVILVLIGLFLVFSVIAHFLPEPPPRETPPQRQPESITTTEKTQSFFYSVLYDVNFPKLYESTKEDFIAYFKKIKHENWLNYEFAHNEETAHFHLTEKRRGIAFEKYIDAISITDEQDETFFSITLVEAIRIAERFLPSTMPPSRADFTKEIAERITWNKTLERIYFIPGDDYLDTTNVIMYTSKFLCNERNPEDGQFSTAITILIKENRIQSITIGGMQYEPARHQKTYNLSLTIVSDFENLLAILNNGIETAAFAKYQE